MKAAARARSSSSLALLVFNLLLLAAAREAAADTTGSISGYVTDQVTKKPLAGVTVVVNGPQGEATEFTDSNGRYLITDLPPGDYIVRFYYSNVKIERPNVRVEADKTLSVPAAIPTSRARELRVVIKERAPTVDVATTQVQTQITEELTRTTPIGQSSTGGRTFQSVLTLAPGSATDNAGGAGQGLSFSGATGPENQYFIDGLNTTRPSNGLIGTGLALEFIKETEVITSGYNAEYGRATGGVVNIVTKSGTNQLHGDVWGTWTPLALDPPRIGRPGEAVARIQRDLDHAWDIGLDVGGPIVKDHLFFFVGFTPSFHTATYDRILRARTANDFDAMSSPNPYLGDLDKSIACPPWLKSTNEALCQASASAAYRTVDLDERFWRHYRADTRNYAGIAKLNLRINDNHSITLTYTPGYSFVETVFPARFNGNPDTDLSQANQPSQTHDIIGRYTGKMLDRKLQLDLNVGWHYEEAETTPTALGASQSFISDGRTLSLATFENEAEPCKVQQLGTDMSPKTFNPCPVSSYRDGGFGSVDKTWAQRVGLAVGATYFLKLLGTHAIKLGGDFEYNWFKHYRAFPGTPDGNYTILNGNVVQRSQYAALDPNDPTEKSVIVYDGTSGKPLGFTATTTTLDEAVYLRDSWTFGFLPGFTLNAGVRWEGQQVKDVFGNTQIGLYNNWAPRLGFVWDFLRNGRSKLYASYGRYYESIPLDINDRQFSREGTVVQNLAPGDVGACTDENTGTNRIDPTQCKFPKPTRNDLLAGTLGSVSPGLQGQYSNEYVVGLQYDVGLDVVLGAAYIHRDLGRIIEDISADGGQTFVIANPSEAADSGTVSRLRQGIDQINSQIDATSDQVALASLDQQRREAVRQLALYEAAAKFPKPVRDYNALVLTATKRFSHNFILLGSYTYSRTIGNYPGLFQASNGQLDPNISTQYDLPELLINRYGPLPSDRPHNFKLTAAYSVPLGRGGTITLGANFSAISGTPIEVLGRHPTYGPGESFILPRGSGGRTPTVTQLDARLSYAVPFAKQYRAEVSIDVFNVLNQQTPLSVDQNYTNDPVMPIVNGSYDQLKYLRTNAGAPVVLNPNYGQPTIYQAPLSLRLAARLMF